MSTTRHVILDSIVFDQIKGFLTDVNSTLKQLRVYSFIRAGVLGKADGGHDEHYKQEVSEAQHFSRFPNVNITLSYVNYLSDWMFYNLQRTMI